MGYSGYNPYTTSTVGISLWCVCAQEWEGDLLVLICFVLFCGMFGRKRNVLMSIFGHTFSCVGANNWDPVRNCIFVYEHDLTC